ncbi:PilZ domain-containing protein [Sphingomonas sp.]|uniref:PilZ domain-containing protein n=1 Tax=Sphingomonas sp. TaxID=28214 RepID=UPI002D80014F|nr:PilZ domain-containing protein [Sphingomonas sp.]HEU0044850.1 PilZ domain-containing protein [Sphingomonas sp.]
MAASALGWVQEERSEARDAVHHRTRAAHTDGRLLPIVIVNTSVGGLMARCEASCEQGDRLRIDLPIVGALPVEVRWSLGGRIGCRFVQPMQPADYYTLLGALRR